MKSTGKPRNLTTSACLILFVLLFWASKGTGQAQSGNSTLQPNHDFSAWPAFIDSQLKTNDSGGYCFVVRRDGRVMISGTGGYARMPWENTSPRLRWNTNKRMHIASVSKPITAVAFLKLWEEKGKQFSLDEPFWPYVQHLFPDAAPLSKTITFRHLLTHRSGIRKEGNNLTLAQARVGMAKTDNPAPGTKRIYGGQNYFLLRLCIDAIGKKPYTQYVKNHVLKTAGAYNMDTRPETTAPVLTYTGSSKHPGNAMSDFTSGAGGVGWYASALELTAFGFSVASGKIISPQTVNEMFDGNLGWARATHNGKTIGYFHRGCYGGPRGTAWSVLIHFVDGVDAALLINSDKGEPFSIMKSAWLLGKGVPANAENSEQPSEF